MALRTPLPVQPNMYMTDTAGRPLDGGRVYFGESGKDPELYPIDVFYDEQLTIAAAQPVITKNGFLNIGGNTVGIYGTADSYSVKVLDAHGVQVLYLSSMKNNDNFIAALNSAVEKSVQETQEIKQSLNIGLQEKSDEIAVVDSKLIQAKSELEIKDAELQGQINSVGGGKFAYTTYAKMVAAAALPAEDPLKIPPNASIDVTNDTDTTKNGTYSYDGSVFTKSPYDPLALSKSYTDSKTKNLNSSVDTNLMNFTDAVDNVYAAFDKDASLQLSAPAYVNGKELTAGGDVKINAARHQSILTLQPKIKTLIPVATQSEDNLINRMPAGITTPTGLVYFYHQQIEGFDGDNTGSELYKAIITIDGNLNVTVVSRELFLSPDEPRGIVKHPMLGRTSDNRIILMYEKRLETTDIYVRYQCYSDDEGLTFTAPTIVAPNGVNPAAKSVLGTTGTILTARDNRLVVPMYTGGGSPYVIYSDDDGATWEFSSIVPSIRYAAEPSITLDLDVNILMDLRNGYLEGSTINYRAKAISYDNGQTWSLFDSQKITPVAKNQGTVFTDTSIGAILHTYNAATTRDHYTIALSYDNGKTFPYRYRPFSDTWYGGYSQVLKWREGVYIVIIEYADDYIGTNKNENAGLVVLNLSEVLSNVSYY